VFGVVHVGIFDIRTGRDDFSETNLAVCLADGSNCGIFNKRDRKSGVGYATAFREFPTVNEFLETVVALGDSSHLNIGRLGSGMPGGVFHESLFTSSSWGKFSSHALRPRTNPFDAAVAHDSMESNSCWSVITIC